MHAQKYITLVIYLAIAIAGITQPDTVFETVAIYFFGLLPIVHLLEFAFVYRLLNSAQGSLAHHFLHTMIFGYVHWLPIKQAVSKP